jgi:hypothetical protein
MCNRYLSFTYSGIERCHSISIVSIWYVFFYNAMWSQNRCLVFSLPPCWRQQLPLEHLQWSTCLHGIVLHPRKQQSSESLLWGPQTSLCAQGASIQMHVELCIGFKNKIIKLGLSLCMSNVCKWIKENLYEFPHVSAVKWKNVHVGINHEDPSTDSVWRHHNCSGHGDKEKYSGASCLLSETSPKVHRHS